MRKSFQLLSDVELSEVKEERKEDHLWVTRENLNSLDGGADHKQAWTDGDNSRLN